MVKSMPAQGYLLNGCIFSVKVLLILEDHSKKVRSL